jgi:Ala-tRNA(Pro) deacylase
MRVPSFLVDQLVPFETLMHPPAYTAQRLARYLGLPGSQVVKGVLLRGPAGFLLAVLPATQQVNVAAVASHLGNPMRLADAQEIAEVFGDCEWGVVSPFGRLYGIGTILEDALTSETMIVFEGHSHAEAIRLRCADYERLERPRRLRFAQAVSSRPAR